MKKFILTLAAIAIGGMTYAQVAGAPTAAYVPALPGAGAGANTGLSIQNGDDQRVRVRQAGTLQSAYTSQDNGTGTGGNMALVRQTGSVQAASGVANAAEVRQSGTENSSITRQEGDYNNAVTNQGQNDPSSAYNKAYIRQGVADQAEDNYAAVEQDGVGNLATTRQVFDNSDAWTQQTGNENKSMINQNAGPNQTDGHEARNFQLGDRNESTINQGGAGARNIATANQTGDDNQIKQWQRTNATSGGTGNLASARQGPGGPAQNFSAYGANVAPIRSFADAAAGVYWPSASGPIAVGNKIKQTQYGQNNTVNAYQLSGLVGAASYAEQYQEVGSSGNTASIGQGHYFQGDPDNYAKQYQSGDDNNAGILSSGSGHKILQDQRGNNNNAWSSQLGQDNLANVHQRGDYNAGATGQRGVGNAALLVQHDGQSYSIHQNLNVPSPFSGGVGGNQADILQMGPDGDFGAGAIDCAFEQPMNLDMDFTVPMPQFEDICPDC